MAWPTAWVLLLLRALPEPGGVVLPTMSAVAALVVVGRLRRAVYANHHYRFTTSRWCRAVGTLLVIGWMLKSMLGA
ncbi:hypothetical protein [Methylibium sp. Root1272]|uniref:hypothetical protein n=1 Tax=Methylibium sp. Root1272 TaxID=1736441 RepID=UPI001F15EB4D|nr:hypothetical protein [Methylibium sp. Root1272]